MFRYWMVSSRPLTASADFWAISEDAGWAWVAVAWETGDWPGAGLLGEGWTAACWAWLGCLRRAGLWGGAGLEGVCAPCWEVELTTGGGVVCCWTVGCTCGWMSALFTGDTIAAAAAVVSAPVAAAGCTACHTETDYTSWYNLGYISKQVASQKTRIALSTVSIPDPKSNCEYDIL